ncbi:serine/threonine protein kinase [Volvox carteri f. nagariensis]|uniref:Serine/threonine protein kinase n=1 Tax=Volvox carteri f. nagariensis TaxID=3068 RepID=D8TNN4_VOLCA|nr:serine/threonine protein kinase [Volvox carteri f. nagariensis]EFJ51022.1 serine/threonine protein kinase [Volvox carteri f. nagariensis]|eukprot:XP_002948034.1 serine/threonine protein kinase [Volvox carteri f. nagariensis]
MDLPGYYNGARGDMTYVDSAEKQDKQGFLKGLLGSKDEAKKLSPKPSAPASASVPKKFMDMISPLLLGSSTSSSAANSPAAHHHAQQPKSPAAPPAVSAFSKAAAALNNAAAVQVCATDGCAAVDAQNMSRAMSYNSGLTEYVNKMKISEAGSPAAPEPAPQQQQQSAPLSAGHQAGAPLNSHAYASNLDRLLEAARFCQLPQSGRPLQPMPADPLANPHHGPTIPLVVSPNLPPRMQRSQWRLSDYALGDKLYTGYASTVYKAVCRASGEVVVLKIYHLMSVCDLYKYQIYREVRVHSSLCHENIVHLYAAFQEGDKVILVQEYADGSDLFTLLHKYGGRLTERLAVQLVLEPFLRVLQYLHSRAIIHRDIKPENILFNKAMCLKLGDFGLAIDLREERAVTRAGTLDYMAPEVLRCPFKSRPEENKENDRLHYSARVDAWAVGVLTYELLVGFPPFFDQSRTSTEDRIVHSMPAFPAGMSDEARAFISSALSKHANERPTILEMLHHPWIARFSARRSMRSMASATLQQPPALQSPGSGPVTPLRPPAPAPSAASSGYPTLGSLVGSGMATVDVAKMHHHTHHAPPSPQSPLVMKSSSESTELNSRFSHGSSNASMQMEGRDLMRQGLDRTRVEVFCEEVPQSWMARYQGHVDGVEIGRRLFALRSCALAQTPAQAPPSVAVLPTMASTQRLALSKATSFPSLSPRALPFLRVGGGGGFGGVQGINGVGCSGPQQQQQQQQQQQGGFAGPPGLLSPNGMTAERLMVGLLSQWMTWHGLRNGRGDVQ